MPPTPAPKPASLAVDAPTASQRIDRKLDELGDWRARTLRTLRGWIHAADPAVQEEWKWDIPVWSHAGILCTGETYKAKVKLTFAHGAALPDPSGLFNASLDGKVRRALDLAEGELPDAAAFRALIRAAAAYNEAHAKPAKAGRAAGSTAGAKTAR